MATGAEHELPLALVLTELLFDELIEAELVVGESLEIHELG